MRLGDRTSAIAEDVLRIPKPGTNNRNDILIKIRALPIGTDETLERHLTNEPE